jgi:hypothetical protein
MEEIEEISVAVDFEVSVVVVQGCWPEVLLVVVLHVVTGLTTVVVAHVM